MVKKDLCPEKYPIAMIISGGQTGADRAGLDYALNNKIQIGGWCPKGRRSEDGQIPSKYKLLETSGSCYPQRTRQNVIDSDATIIFTIGKPHGGTSLTIKYAIKYKKPHLVVDFNSGQSIDEIAESIKNWLWIVKPNILNIAGCRSSEHSQIYSLVYQALSLSITSKPNLANEFNEISWPTKDSNLYPSVLSSKLNSKHKSRYKKKSIEKFTQLELNFQKTIKDKN